MGKSALVVEGEKDSKLHFVEESKGWMQSLIEFERSSGKSL